MSANNGVWILDTVKTPDTTDVFPVVRAIDILGGHHQVADLTERDAIFSARRSEGMTCWVVSESKTYRLQGGIDNSNWVELAGDSASQTSGTVSIVSGNSTVTVTGLGLSFTPSVAILTVEKPGSGDGNIFAVLEGGSLSSDGFTAHLSSTVNISGYVLHYLLML